MVAKRRELWAAMPSFMALSAWVIALLGPAPSLAQVGVIPPINGAVAVCDPLVPANCLKPAANGSVAVTGASGGGIGTTANPNIAGGAAGTAFTQGTGPANANSQNVVTTPAPGTLNVDGGVPSHVTNQITGFALDTSVGTTNTDLGAPGTPVATADTGSFAINAILQRVAQNITLVKTQLGTPFQTGGAVGQGAQAGTGTASTAWWLQGIETPGATATGGGERMNGVDETGKARDVATDTTGALAPAQGTPANPGVVSIPASTAMSLGLSTDFNREGLSVITESANAAPIYVCFIATTTCSATVHDDVMPINTAAAAHFTPLFAPTGTVYLFTTSATSASAEAWDKK